MLKILVLAVMLTGISLASFTFKEKKTPKCLVNIVQPDPGLTGSATSGVYCDDCHNVGANGSVQIVGLPAAGISPSTTYNFSVIISHTITGTQTARLRWGFAINARNPTNTADLGTFSTTNPNATVNSSNELTHLNAPLVPAAASYTYANLTWTSPAVINDPVTFYVAGLAGNGGNTSGGDYSYKSTISRTSQNLPVKMGNVTASVIKNNQVQINWNTLNELNVQHFEIEESVDGISFTKIGQQNATGTSTNTQNYSFIQAKPAAINKRIYYRIKIVDRDGQFSYSAIASVRLDEFVDFVQSISPSLLRKGQNASLILTSRKPQNLELEIVNVLGQRMRTQTTSVSAGANKIEVNTSQLNTGQYFVKIEIGTSSQTISFIVE